MFLGAEITYDADAVYKPHLLGRPGFERRLGRDKRVNISIALPSPP